MIPNCEVLEVENRDYTNKDGEARSYHGVMIRALGKVVKLSVSKGVDLLPYDGKKVGLEVELSTFGQSLEPSLRVVGIVK